MKNNQTKFKETEIGTIPEEWDVGSIGDLARAKAGYAIKSSDFTDVGIGVIKIKNIDNRIIDLQNTDKISEESFNKLLNDFVLGAGDVVVAMTGATIGKVGKIRNTKYKYALNQRVARFISKNQSDLEFVFQYSGTKYFIDAINNYANGAAQQNISADDIASILIPIPSINEREQIAEILSSLDDKIELNRQINANLEKIASSLFKHWFVDFEFPVSSPPDKGELKGVGESDKARESILFIPYNPKLKEFARENRKNPTMSERKIWKILSGKQFENLKFSRQKPLDNFIADFYCASLKFIIEIDGDSHSEKQEYDQLRSDILKEKYGIEVVRYANNEIMNNIEGVYDDLIEKIKIRGSNSTHPCPPTHPNPPLSGRGKEMGYRSSGGKMIDSELGEIPEGWKVGKLSDISNITIGRTPPRMQEQWFSENPQDVKWISIRDLGISGIYINKTAEYLTKEAVERFNIPIIPKNTVILSFKLTVGRVAITTENMLSNEAIAHIKLLDKNISQEYIYLMLKKFDFTSLGTTSSIATAVNSKSIKDIPVLIFNENIIKSFSNIIKPLFDYIYDNTIQIDDLTQVRDSLLLRLMNGKIRVK